MEACTTLEATFFILLHFFILLVSNNCHSVLVRWYTTFQCGQPRRKLWRTISLQPLPIMPRKIYTWSAKSVTH